MEAETTRNESIQEEAGFVRIEKAASFIDKPASTIRGFLQRGVLTRHKVLNGKETYISVEELREKCIPQPVEG